MLGVAGTASGTTADGRYRIAHECILISGGNFVNGYFQIQSSTANMTVFCPVMNDFNHLTQSLSPFHVDAWQGSANSLTVKACYAGKGGGTGGCDAATSISTTGVVNLGVPSTAWHNHPGDYWFASVSLANSGETFFGYSTDSP